MLSLAARTTLRSAVASGSHPGVSPIAVRYVGSTNHDNDPEVLEEEKRKNLTGAQHKSLIDNAPGWNDKLASASEAVVKAERINISPDELQKQTVEAIQIRHSPDDRRSASEASYNSDDVLGPLSSARTVDTNNAHDGTTTTTTIEEKVTTTSKSS